MTVPNFFKAGFLTAGLLLQACDSSGPATDVATISDSELTLPLPDRIRSISALDPNNIVATAIIDGVPTSLLPDGSGGYRASIQVPARSTFSVQVEFSEQFAGEKLVLASRTQQVTTGTGSQRLNLRRSGYNFSAHDSDGDSVSNIIEREEDTDPLDAAQAPQMINVTLVARQPQGLAGSNFSGYLFEGGIGGESKVLTASGGEFRGNFYIVDRSPLVAEVQMIETITDQQLAVATQSQQLNSIADQQTIVFADNIYSAPDTDNDGQSDLQELIAGTDINVSNIPSGNTTVLSTSFSVPASIQNPQATYAEYRVDGQLVSVNRTENSYTGSSSVDRNASVVVDISILDNYNNRPYPLATASKTVTSNTAAQALSFSAADFSLNQDADNDGVLNHIERQQGTDPFNAPVVPEPVSCTVAALPLTTGQAGSTVTIGNVSSYIDCGSDSYALSAVPYNFDWSAQTDGIAWLIPANSTPGDIFTYTINIINPALASEVYATAQVVTQVEEIACTVGTQQLQLQASRDLFFQNNRIFNNDELRVNSSNRTALIGFDIPEQQGALTAAALVVVVGADDGSGSIGVYQDDSYQWNETDDDLVLPALFNLIGARAGAWQEDAAYSIPLDSLYISGPTVSLFLQQAVGGNDVEFNSRETNSPPVLVLEFTGCF